MTSGTGGPRGTGEPAYAVLRGAALPALTVTGLIALGALPVSGAQAGLSALVAGGVAAAGLSTGPLLMRVGRRVEPVAAMGLALTFYAVSVTACALVVGALTSVDWLVGEVAALAFGASLIAWIAGLLVSTARLRVPVFDPPE